MFVFGVFICGVVESVFIFDIKCEGILRRVDLVNIVVCGLWEEFGLELFEFDIEVVCLIIIYLKIDIYEWGLCGYVDLMDDWIKLENYISVDNLKDCFFSGLKDKFEY